jgi:hypothetical protein
MATSSAETNSANASTNAAVSSWRLDPFGQITGGELVLDRVSIVRIACVAAEAGARIQREALSVDALEWIVTPLGLFRGTPPIEACAERSAFAQAILLHGLGLDLNADPALISALTSENRDLKPEIGHD